MVQKMQKKQLRDKLFRKRARAFSIDQVSGLIAAGELALIGADYLSSAQCRIQPSKSVVAGYIPIGSEIDPRPLMAVIAAHGATLCLPEVVSADAPLQFRAWAPGDLLVNGLCKTLQPLETAAIVEPDFILLPLVGVDQHGVRLGQGGGFYDRSLEALAERNAGGTSDVLAFGVAFDEQMVDELPKEIHDQYLDGLFSPHCCKLWNEDRQVSYVVQK